MRSLFDPVGSVSECADGDGAVEAYAEHLPDWVFMDVEMARVDGFTAAQKIQSRFKDARIMFITQYSEPEYCERAERIGARYLAKDRVDVLQSMIQSGFFQTPLMNP